MPEQKHVIVVGAGIIGASIAWHLIRAGARVTVIGTVPGGIATPRSFAWINASWGNPESYFRLRTHSMAEWKRLAAEVPDLPLSWHGGLCWDLPPDELMAYAEEHRRWGYGLERVDAAAMARLEPALAAYPEVALHVAAEGAVEPDAAARALLADAERQGAIVHPGAVVVSLLETSGTITGVKTSSGNIDADHVVLAAGAGTADLAAGIGVAVPIETPPGLLVYSRPHARLLNGLVLAPELHMRQTIDGRIVAGSDFGGTQPGADPETTAQCLFAKVTAMFHTADLEFESFGVGYRPTPRDGFPIIGAVDGHAGLTIAVMHSGITLAPAIGLLTAGEIMTGEDSPLLEPYRLSRFN